MREPTDDFTPIEREFLANAKDPYVMRVFLREELARAISWSIDKDLASEPWTPSLNFR